MPSGESAHCEIRSVKMQISDFFDIFDYSSSDMGQVKSAVAEGDFERAKKELLSYFIKRKKSHMAYSPAIDESDKNPALAYVARHSILPGPNEADVYLSSIFVSKSSDSVSLDIMPFIKKHLSFMIMSRQKEPDAAFLFSPGSIFPPHVIIVTKSGREIKLPCSKYAYVSTSEPDTPLSDEDIFEIREESRTDDEAYGINTSRCYLGFDLTGVERGDIESARFTAKITLSENISKKELLLFNIADSSWDNSLTWNKIKGNVYSWESSSTGPSWNPVSGSDSEYLNVICRFNFARPMAYRYLSDVEKNTIYGERLLFLMSAFSKKKEGGYNRVLETGERLSNFTAVLGALLDTPAMTPDLIVDILSIMYRDIKHLMENPDMGWSNWAVVRTSGLSKALDFLPELKDYAEWRSKTRSDMEMLFDRMYSSDFSFRESGYAYSFWCIELFASAFKCAEMNNDPYSAFMRGRLEKAIDAAIDLIYPNFYDTNIGDSNYADKLPFLKKIYSVFPTKKLGAFLSGKDDSSLSLSNCYSYANLAVMRSSFDQSKAMHMVVHASPFDGHAHADLGSVTFYAYGRPLITDNGRYGYSGSDISSYLKTPAAHNSVEIEGASPNIHSKAEGKILSFASNSMFDFVKLSFNPYEEPDAKQIRNVFFSKCDNFAIVSDNISCDQSARRFNQSWNFLPYSNATVDFENRIETHFPVGANIKLVTASADTSEIRKSIFSAGYGIAASSKRGVFTKYGQRASFTTLLLPFTSPIHASAAELSPRDGSFSAARFTVESKSGIFYAKNTASGELPMCEFDGDMLYMESDRIFIAGGKRLTINKTLCVESENVIPDLYLHISGGIIEAESSSLHQVSSRNEAMKIYAPKTTHVLFNGRPIPFTLYCDYVYALGV